MAASSHSIRERLRTPGERKATPERQQAAAKVLVIGASGHAKVVIDIIERQGVYEIAGLIDTYREPGAKLMGYEVIGPEGLLPTLVAEGQIAGGIVAIGHNWIRSEVVKRVREHMPGFVFVNAIHPSARIGRDVQFGCGIAVMAGATINAGTRVGDFCFINTNASVDHDNVLEPFSSLQPNSATGGNVTVGEFSSISMGANVIHRVTIGPHTIIGAGSTVLSDISGSVIAYGTPCKAVRARQPEENYY